MRGGIVLRVLADGGGVGRAQGVSYSLTAIYLNAFWVAQVGHFICCLLELKKGGRQRRHTGTPLLSTFNQFFLCNIYCSELSLIRFVACCIFDGSILLKIFIIEHHR